MDSEPSGAVLARRQAQLAAAAGHLEESIALYEHALALQRETLGCSHPEVAATLHDLALVHETLGSTDLAHALWAEARAMLEPNLALPKE